MLQCKTKSEIIPALFEQFPAAENPDKYIFRNHDETIFDLFHSSPLNMIGGLLVKKDLITGIRFNENFIIGEDKLFIYECVKSNADYVIIPERWYFQRLHSVQSSCNDSRNAFLSRYMRRKVFWLSELEQSRSDNAKIEISEAFSIALRHLKRHKSLKEIAFVSHIIRKDRAYYKTCLNCKCRLLMIFLSYCNPLLLFEQNDTNLKKWTDCGLL
ncbi:MAG: hypothetical protein MJ132_08100 [Clostridia bacterium]|nr:hypothetical protein [Clostridia bacterium]